MRSLAFGKSTQAPARTDTNTWRIKRQLWRDKELCVYTVIYIQEGGG